MPRAEWRSVKLSAGPYSVRRMMEHDPRCESTTRGVAERFRFLCLQAGLAQAQLADELGARQSAIERLKRGLQSTSLEAISRFAIAFGCETAMLIEQGRIA
jgi:ribosome-binding protein aMBF1 (putative translation factor)